MRDLHREHFVHLQSHKGINHQRDKWWFAEKERIRGAFKVNEKKTKWEYLIVGGVLGLGLIIPETFSSDSRLQECVQSTIHWQILSKRKGRFETAKQEWSAMWQRETYASLEENKNNKYRFEPRMVLQDISAEVLHRFDLVIHMECQFLISRWLDECDAFKKISKGRSNNVLEEQKETWICSAAVFRFS